MVAPIGSPNPQALYSPLNSDNRPAQLPTEPPPTASPPSPGDSVSISDEAKNLFAARAVGNVVDNPIATAAVSNNPQVDKTATAIYQGQQAQQAVDTYTNAASSASSSQSSSSSSDRSPLGVAAVSDNPKTDELATTVYGARTAQQLVAAYQQASQSADAQYTSGVSETA